MKSLDDVICIRLDDLFVDERGSISTIYNEKDPRYLGIKFNHDKICTRMFRTLVGIHGDFHTWKLVTCLQGRINTIVVDNRPDSVDYLKHRQYWMGGSGDECRIQLLLPPGIGNSFLVYSDWCLYHYKLYYTGNYIDADDQFTLRWNDPKLNINWGTTNPILSERDKNAPLLP